MATYFRNFLTGLSHAEALLYPKAIKVRPMVDEEVRKLPKGDDGKPLVDPSSRVRVSQEDRKQPWWMKMRKRVEGRYAPLPKRVGALQHLGFYAGLPLYGVAKVGNMIGNGLGWLGRAGSPVIAKAYNYTAGVIASGKSKVMPLSLWQKVRGWAAYALWKPIDWGFQLTILGLKVTFGLATYLVYGAYAVVIGAPLTLCSLLTSGWGATNTYATTWWASFWDPQWADDEGDLLFENEFFPPFEKDSEPLVEAKAAAKGAVLSQSNLGKLTAELGSTGLNYTHPLVDDVEDDQGSDVTVAPVKANPLPPPSVAETTATKLSPYGEKLRQEAIAKRAKMERPGPSK